MNDIFHIFQYFQSQIIPPFDASVQAIIGQLANGSLSYVWKIIVVAWFAGIMLVYAMMPPGGGTLNIAIKHLVLAAVAIGICSSAASYNQFVGTFLLQTVPNELSQRVAGGVGGTPINGSAFDKVWGTAYAGGLLVFRNLPSYSFSGLVLKLIVVAYWIAAGLTAAICFMIWLYSHLTLGLLVAVGPLILPAIIFPATKGIFSHWVGGMLSMIALQVFTVVVLSILFTAEYQIINQIVTLANANQNNEADQVGWIICGLILFSGMLWLIRQLPQIAGSITHGVYVHTGQAFGAVGGVVNSARGAASSIGSSGPRARARVMAGPPGAPSTAGRMMP